MEGVFALKHNDYLSVFAGVECRLALSIGMNGKSDGGMEPWRKQDNLVGIDACCDTALRLRLHAPLCDVVYINPVLHNPVCHEIHFT